MLHYANLHAPPFAPTPVVVRLAAGRRAGPGWRVERPARAPRSIERTHTLRNQRVTRTHARYGAGAGVWCVALDGARHDVRPAPCCLPDLIGWTTGVVA